MVNFIKLYQKPVRNFETYYVPKMETIKQEIANFENWISNSDVQAVLLMIKKWATTI